MIDNPVQGKPCDSARIQHFAHCVLEGSKGVSRLADLDLLMAYCQFFATQDAAIAHCRERNKGLSSTDPGVCCVVDGPGEWQEPDGTVVWANYAVVDLETAKDLTDDGEGAPYLIVT